MKADKKQNFRLKDVINSFCSIEQLCRQEAEKNPVGKDLFQSGKQQAYSHIYFEIRPILEKSKWLNSDGVIYKISIGVIAFCLGFLACMWAFGLMNDISIL